MGTSLNERFSQTLATRRWFAPAAAGVLMTAPGQGPEARTSPVVAPASAYWNAGQLAAFVNRPVKTVYKWPDKYPDMPCARIGRTKLFPIERVVRWLQAQEQGRASPQRAHSNGTAQTSGALSKRCAEPCADGAGGSP